MAYYGEEEGLRRTLPADKAYLSQLQDKIAELELQVQRDAKIHEQLHRLERENEDMRYRNIDLETEVKYNRELIEDYSNQRDEKRRESITNPFGARDAGQS